MLIAGNWKMNTICGEAVSLADEVVQEVSSLSLGAVRVAVCPPFVSLDAVGRAVAGSPVLLGAQNMHQSESGAFTGEVSGSMLRSVGCSMVILGHSERRQYFAEDDQLVNLKCGAARKAGLTPIVCVGETLDQREAGMEESVVGEQIRGAFEGIQPGDGWQPVVAYEPVWAIGTGHTATPDQAQSMHRFIRSCLEDLFGRGPASSTEILYGGSMKPSNADDLLAQPDIDGGLIGGASLSAADFASLVRSAIKVAGHS